MRAIIVLGLMLAGCGTDGEKDGTGNGVLAEGPRTRVSEVAAASVPVELSALIERTVPGMKVLEAERKERSGRVYYDVEGTRPDGSEVELDILEGGGRYTVVEIQRDIAWTQAPAPVIAAANAAPDAFAPERVIESTQTDGSVIYELFAPGRHDEPAVEVRLKDGRAAVLDERNPH